MTDQEINEAVAKKLGGRCGCGHKIEEHSDGRKYGNGGAICSNAFCKCEEIKYLDYCHSIDAACEIVRYWIKRKYEFQIHFEKEKWVIEGFEHAEDKEAPMAICKAFLGLK